MRGTQLVLGCVIWLVWSLSWLVGAGARDPAGSRLRFLAGVVAKLAGGCGCVGPSWF